MSVFSHQTVMREEVVNWIKPRAGGIYVDCTLGGGGHAELILEKSAPDGIVIGIDRDLSALEAAQEKLKLFSDRVIYIHGTFGSLSELLKEKSIKLIDGLIADVGVSSAQLDQNERGFSFQREGPLDMRMDNSSGETALELIGRLNAEELAHIIYEYGEERRSRAIAREIKKAYERNELETTRDLVRVIHRTVGYKRGKIDPATLTFQALRIAVNEELNQLDLLLKSIPEILSDQGIAVLIAFHSLEDRIVKWAFRNSEELTPCHKRPILATDEEIKRNPRARSAKLRAAQRISRSEEMI